LPVGEEKAFDQSGEAMEPQVPPPPNASPEPYTPEPEEK